MIPTREQIVSWSNMAVASSTRGWSLYRGEVDNAANWFSSMRDEIDRLTAANETGGAALLSAQREVAKLKSDLRARVLRSDADGNITVAECENCAKLRADLDRANIEAALARDALDKAQAARSEITAAVALMRRADGKALLRELRAWIIDERWVAGGIVSKIDEMLAKPAPVEQPAAAVPENHDEGRMCMLCCGYVPSGSKFAHGVGVCVPEPVPVTKPAAAEPDDTRELVAQLGHFVCMMLKGEANRAEVRGIMAKLRGGA